MAIRRKKHCLSVQDIKMYININNQKDDKLYSAYLSSNISL